MYIEDLCSQSNFSVVGICESWLLPEIPDSLIEVTGYNLFRNDTTTRNRKHGVCMYVRKELSVGNVSTNHPNTLGVALPGLDLNILLVYRPPSNSPADDLGLINYIRDSCEGKNVCLIGDLNLPTIDWKLNPPRATSQKDRAFLDCFVSLGLVQHISDPTFIPSGNTLDLVFTTQTDHLSSVELLAPLPGCGHVPITFSLAISSQAGNPSRPPVTPSCRDWFKGDYVSISSVMHEVDWIAEFTGRSLDDSYSLFSQTLSGLIDLYVPTRTTRQTSAKPWNKNVPNHLRTAKASAWNEYKTARAQFGRTSHQAINAWHGFSVCNSDIKNFKLSSKSLYESELLQSFIQHPRRLHSYLRNQKTNRPRVGPLLTNDVMSDDPTTMAECLVDAFSGVLNASPPPLAHAHQTADQVLNNIEISLNAVKTALKNLDPTSSMGPDGIHPLLLKTCRESIALPLLLLFTRSLSEKRVPGPWKDSNITPIYKKGLHSDPLNYRPISLTSICSKTMERILSDAIRHHLENNNLLSNAQFGFRPGRSVLDQLIISYNYITEQYDLGNVVDLVLFDFKKAFDMVPHTILLDKLFLLGFRDPILGWLADFLRNRTMRVVVSGVSSTSRPVNSGVPQGSVIGPLLFIIFINHLIHDLHSFTQLFADDLKLYLGLTRNLTTYTAGKSLMQADIDLLSSRASSWGLDFAVHKCIHMRFVRPFANNPPVIPFTINSHPVPTMEKAADLGIQLDSDLRFHDHVSLVVAKAYGVSNNIARGTVCRSPEFMREILISHIRPLLDFCSPVWNLGYIGDTKSLESVQRRWTKKIDGYSNLTYYDRLRALSLYSIWGRLLRADLILVWRIVHGFAPVPEDILPRSTISRTRGHPYKLSVRRPATDARKRFFSYRIVPQWNNLPNEVVTSPSLNIFKSRLHSALGDLLYYYHGYHD